MVSKICWTFYVSKTLMFQSLLLVDMVSKSLNFIKRLKSMLNPFFTDFNLLIFSMSKNFLGLYSALFPYRLSLVIPAISTFFLKIQNKFTSGELLFYTNIPVGAIYTSFFKFRRFREFISLNDG